MVNQINAGSVYSDSMIYFRDVLSSNVTDPISGSRPSNSRFVMTSYPQKNAVYPMVIVQDGNMVDNRLGMQSEASLIKQEIIITVDARNVKERDEISQNIYNFMRLNQYGAGSETVNFGFHDYRLVSSVNLQKAGEQGTNTRLQTKLMTYEFFTVIGD